MDYQKLYPIFGFQVSGAFSNWWIFKQYGQNRVVAKYYYPYNPKTELQQAWRDIFLSAVGNWQDFSENTKGFYNQGVLKKPLSGYNRYIGLYLSANYPPILGDYLLMETGDKILLETGDGVLLDYYRLLMEDGEFLLLETGGKIIGE